MPHLSLRHTASDEETFQHYLRDGDNALHYDKRGEKPWHTFFRYGGERFCGTAFYGYAWPAEIAGKKPEVGVGAYYFGLWEPIIEALRDGRVEELVGLEVTPGTTEHNGKLFVLQSDGIALAWAASEAELQPGMFDELPGSSLQAHSQEKEPSLVAESSFHRYKAS